MAEVSVREDSALPTVSAHSLSPTAMRVHAALGNRAGVTRQFERCRQALLEEANAPLSAEIEALYEGHAPLK